MRRVILIAAALAASGCTASIDAMLESVGADPGTATRVTDKTIGYAVKPIPVYCNAPVLAREQLRAQINAHPGMAGNEIGIWCAGDPPLTLGEVE